MSVHATQSTRLRTWLAVRGWDTALAAMDFAAAHHTGIRKDGVTPEFNHQVSIGLYLAPLVHTLDQPETTLAVAFLHDVCEDYDVSPHVIEARFGAHIAAPTWALTKTYQGQARDHAEVRAAQEACPVASIVKGADRIHNQSTMVGVFTPAKVSDYLAETETYIRPMLEVSCRRHHSQRRAYAHALAVLDGQAAAIRSSHTLAA